MKDSMIPIMMKENWKFRDMVIRGKFTLQRSSWNKDHSYCKEWAITYLKSKSRSANGLSFDCWADQSASVKSQSFKKLSWLVTIHRNKILFTNSQFNKQKVLHNHNSEIQLNKYDQSVL